MPTETIVYPMILNKGESCTTNIKNTIKFNFDSRADNGD